MDMGILWDVPTNPKHACSDWLEALNSPVMEWRPGCIPWLYSIISDGWMGYLFTWMNGWSEGITPLQYPPPSTWWRQKILAESEAAPPSCTSGPKILLSWMRLRLITFCYCTDGLTTPDSLFRTHPNPFTLSRVCMPHIISMGMVRSHSFNLLPWHLLHIGCSSAPHRRFWPIVAAKLSFFPRLIRPLRLLSDAINPASYNR